MNDIFLKVKEVAPLLNKSYQHIQRLCMMGKLSAELRKGNGGEQYLISLSSLPEEIRIKYIQEKLPVFPEDESKVNKEADVISSIPEWQKDFVQKYINLIKETENLKGAELKSFLSSYTGIKGLSYGNFMKRKKAYNEFGIEALLPNWGKNEGLSKIEEEDYNYFKELYLSQNQPSLHSCWFTVYGRAIAKNYGEVISNYPTEHSFLRRLKKELGEQNIAYARMGKTSWNKKYANFISRDYSDLEAGSVWISDHRQLDIMAIDSMPDPKDKLKLINWLDKDKRKNQVKPSCPWITVWIDYRTGMWLSWNIHSEAPNSDHILETFFLAVEKYGRPNRVYLDNGKDYRCRDFAGGRVKKIKGNFQPQRESVLKILNVEVTYAKPYGAQSKIIERSFRDLKDHFDKQLVGYRGGNITERPEKLIKEIKRNKIHTFSEVSEMLDFYINEIHNKTQRTNSKMTKGKSPLELWNELYKGLPKPTPDALKILCTRSSNPRTIKRNGILVDWKFNIYYYAEWMNAYKGVSVYMRRAPNKYEEAWVFNASSGEYLGIAELGKLNSDAMAETNISRKQLEAALISKRNEENDIKASLPKRKPIDYDKLKHTARAVAALSNTGTDGPMGNKSNIFIKTKFDEVINTEKTSQEIGQYSTMYKLYDDTDLLPKKKYFDSEFEKMMYEKKMKMKKGSDDAE